MTETLLTSLEIIEGDLLTYLERHGTTPMRRLIREVAWPSPMVLMALGALMRDGLVRGTQHDLEVIIEPVRHRLAEVRRESAAVPGGWGG